MRKISTFMKIIKTHPSQLGRALDSHISKWKIMRFLPDILYLRIRYWLCLHKKMHFSKPIGFNEKLQWLKVYYRDPKYEILADKYKVKDYVNKWYPNLKTIPTIGVWERVEDIDFKTLPNQFVIKCTHDTGSTIICKDKDIFEEEIAKKRLDQALKQNMYYPGREWVYKNISPMIIAEPYYKEEESEELKDYKFMSFNGTVKCSFVCSDRFSSEGLHVTFFDRNWNILPFTRHYPMKKEGIPKPYYYDKMIELAEQMSKGMPFVRIDFYEINREVYFSEYTFFPGSGFEEFTPDEWDTYLGEWLVLPERNSNL